MFATSLHWDRDLHKMSQNADLPIVGHGRAYRGVIKYAPVICYHSPPPNPGQGGGLVGKCAMFLLLHCSSSKPKMLGMYFSSVFLYISYNFLGKLNQNLLFHGTAGTALVKTWQ